MLELVWPGGEDFFSPPESAAVNLPIATSRGRVNTVNDVRPLVTRNLMSLDQ